MIVADSDVLIDYLRGREPARGRIDLELRSGQLGTTAVNLFELLAGARTERETKSVQALVDAMHVVAIDASVARAAADVRRVLEAQGNGIGMADSLIAGACIVRSAVLLTRNRSHFERVEGLVLGRLGQG